MTTPYIDHIGIIVTDFDQAIEKLRPLFGDPTPIKNLPEVGLRAAEFQAANMQIELLQCIDADAEFATRPLDLAGTAPAACLALTHVIRPGARAFFRARPGHCASAIPALSIT